MRLDSRTIRSTRTRCPSPHRAGSCDGSERGLDSERVGPPRRQLTVSPPSTRIPAGRLTPGLFVSRDAPLQQRRKDGGDDRERDEFCSQGAEVRPVMTVLPIGEERGVDEEPPMVNRRSSSAPKHTLSRNTVELAINRRERRVCVSFPRSCVGMPSATLCVVWAHVAAGKLSGRGASRTAFPRGAWERGDATPFRFTG
jgi:hypothetical protein